MSTLEHGLLDRMTLVKKIERLTLELAEYKTVAADRLAQMEADRKQALVWRDDARRYRALIDLLQRSYDGHDTETPGLTVRCTMASGYKMSRIVEATLVWRDQREEPLNLDAAIDAAMKESKS